MVSSFGDFLLRPDPRITENGLHVKGKINTAALDMQSVSRLYC